MVTRISPTNYFRGTVPLEAPSVNNAVTPIQDYAIPVQPVTQAPFSFQNENTKILMFLAFAIVAIICITVIFCSKRR